MYLFIYFGAERVQNTRWKLW